VVQVGAHLAKLSQEALLGEFALQFALALPLGHLWYLLVSQLAQQGALEEKLVNLVKWFLLSEAGLSRVDDWLWHFLISKVCCVVNQILVSLKDGPVFDP